MFYIIGDGEEKSFLHNLAMELKVQDNLIFLGYRNDVENIIKQLDLIVLSSLWEGLPLTPIEAFSQSKTIIATNVDGTSEIVKNNYNGILIESKNSTQISESINELYENNNLRQKMENNAFITFESKFNFKLFISSYRKYYERI